MRTCCPFVQSRLGLLTLPRDLGIILLMETTSNTLTGLTMTAIRMQIAQLGDGIDRVVKHDAGNYTYTTFDGRTWKITQNPKSLLWNGEEA